MNPNHLIFDTSSLEMFQRSFLENSRLMYESNQNANPIQEPPAPKNQNLSNELTQLVNVNQNLSFANQLINQHQPFLNRLPQFQVNEFITSPVQQFQNATNRQTNSTRVHVENRCSSSGSFVSALRNEEISRVIDDTFENNSSSSEDFDLENRIVKKNVVKFFKNLLVIVNYVQNENRDD